MSMTAKLYSISGLSVELGRDRRTVSKALARVPPDGETADGHDGWHLTTVLAAIARSEGRRSHNGDGDDADIRAVEYASRRVSELFERLRGETDIEKRRALIESGHGRVIGEFVNAIEHARASHSPGTRLVEQPYVDKMIGGAVSELLTLCDWQLESDMTKTVKS
jgi:hypothetical protein